MILKLARFGTGAEVSQVRSLLGPICPRFELPVEILISAISYYTEIR